MVMPMNQQRLDILIVRQEYGDQKNTQEVMEVLVGILSLKIALPLEKIQVVMEMILQRIMFQHMMF